MLRSYDQLAKKPQAVLAAFKIVPFTLAVALLSRQCGCRPNTFQIECRGVPGAVILMIIDESAILRKLKSADPVTNLKCQLRPSRVACDLPPAAGCLHHPGNLPKVALIAVT